MRLSRISLLLVIATATKAQMYGQGWGKSTFSSSDGNGCFTWMSKHLPVVGDHPNGNRPCGDVGRARVATTSRPVPFSQGFGLHAVHVNASSPRVHPSVCLAVKDAELALDSRLAKVYAKQEAYDVFMDFNSGHWVSSLDPYVAAFKNTSVPIVLLWWTDAGIHYFSLMVRIHTSMMFLELMSANCSSCSDPGADLRPAPSARYVFRKGESPESVFGPLDDKAASKPLLHPAKLSWPTSNAARERQFLAAGLGAKVQSFSNASAGVKTDVYDFTPLMTKATMQFHVVERAVSDQDDNNDNAWANFEAALHKCHAGTIKDDLCGENAWMDNHMGLAIWGQNNTVPTDAAKLKSLATKLGLPFHVTPSNGGGVAVYVIAGNGLSITFQVSQGTYVPPRAMGSGMLDLCTDGTCPNSTTAPAPVSESAAPRYVTTKRVFSTTAWKNDSAFFLEWLGTYDPSSTYSGCLTRDLAWSLPVNFGIHFPQSTATMDRLPAKDVPPAAAAAAGAEPRRSSADWDIARATATRDAIKASTYTAFMDYSTAFYLPDLGLHVRELQRRKTPFMARRTTDSDGVRLYSITVASPGSGQVFEVHSPRCSDPACLTPAVHEDFARAFGEDGCAKAHTLSRSVAYYDDAWARATALPMQNATIANGLPAPLLTQIRVALSDVEEAPRFLDRFLGETPTHAPVRVGDADVTQCSVSRWRTGVAPFDGHGPGPSVFPNYTIDFVFVTNPLAPDADAWLKWEAWAAELHSDYVGSGWGFDRVLDYHVKIMDGAGSVSTTRPGYSLDDFARLHMAGGGGEKKNASKKTKTAAVPFSAFNVSNACPNGGFAPPFGPGGMIYSSGFGGVQGIEFWGRIDGSVFNASSHPIFAWSGCSPMMGCTFTQPLPACRLRTNSTTAARVPEDWPTDLSAVELECTPGRSISAITFASFGRPAGQCGAFVVNASCEADATWTRTVVERRCLGRRQCRVPADRRVFLNTQQEASFSDDDDATDEEYVLPMAPLPCTGTLNLAVEATCAPTTEE